MTHIPANPNGIRAVIFDYGEVLSSAPDPNVVTSMAGILGVNQERFRQLYASLRHAYDRGDMTASEYWTKLAGTKRAHR